MAVPPGKFIALQAFTTLKEMLSGYAPPRGGEGGEILDPKLHLVLK